MNRAHQIMAECHTVELAGSGSEIVVRPPDATKSFAWYMSVDLTNYLTGLGIEEERVTKFQCQLYHEFMNGAFTGDNVVWISVGKFLEDFIKTRPDLTEKAYSLLHNLISYHPVQFGLTVNPALSTNHKIYPDHHWSLVSTDSNFKPLVHCNGAQLYFSKSQTLKDGKYGIFILQTAAREDANHSAILVPVLRGKINENLGSKFITAIVNEKRRKLYLLYLVEFSLNPRGCQTFKVNGYDLKRGPVDRLGYRRLTAINSKWWTFNLIGHYGGVKITSDPETLTFVSCRITNTDMTQFLSLVYFGRKHAIVKHVYRQHLNSYFVADAEGTGDGKFLFLVYKPGHLANSNLFAAESNLKDKTAFVSVFAVDPINEPHFKLISSSEIDHITFLKTLLPADYKRLISDKYGAEIPPNELIEFAKTIGVIQEHAIQFVGITLKHLIFETDYGVIAVKHFAQHGLSRNIIVNIFTQAYWPSSLKSQTSFISNTYLVRKLLDSKQRAHMLRYNLTPLLNDYRRCANCQKVEENKRRNSARKRIALFKVCRLCKVKNFHLNWKEYPCHYCSIQCMKADWKTHKEIHKSKELLRG